MVTIDELQMRISAQLEGAGNSRIAEMMIEVMDRTGDPAEVALYQAALAALVNADLVRIATNSDVNRRLIKLSQHDSLAVIVELSTWLRFDAKGLYWRDIRNVGPPYLFESPEVVNTAAGYERGRQLMEERGYQWWRQKG